MSFSVCKIKNISGETKTLHGKEFTDDEIYQISDGDRTGWASDDNVLEAITGDTFIVCDGSNTPIVAYSDQIKLLNDRSIEADVIKETALPKMARKSAATVNGVATLLVKIPGTVGQITRYLVGAFGKFDSQVNGDYVKGYLTDEDNILGYGAGTVIRSFTDDEMPSEDEKGWWLLDNEVMKLNGIETTMNLMAGLYIKIVAAKGDSSSDTFRINMYWGKRE